MIALDDYKNVMNEKGAIMKSMRERGISDLAIIVAVVVAFSVTFMLCRRRYNAEV